MTFFQKESMFLNCHFIKPQSPLTQSPCKGDSETLPAIAQTDEPCQCHCFTFKVSCWPWGFLGPILTTNLPIGIFPRPLWLPPRASVIANLLKSADRTSRACFIRRFGDLKIGGASSEHTASRKTQRSTGLGETLTISCFPSTPTPDTGLMQSLQLHKGLREWSTCSLSNKTWAEIPSPYTKSWVW